MSPTALQPTLITMITDAGLVAKLVLIFLMVASIYCWAIILTKWRVFTLARKQDDLFMATFWNGKNFDEILGKCDHYPKSPVASIFKNGLKEFRKFPSHETHTLSTEKIDNIHRALLRSSTGEIAQLERHIHWLATTASAAPFIGLFGTVWGIMNSFQNIGVTGAANLAVVAPGISEALITTATGLGVAIPAVIGYNYFAGQIKKIAVDMECFSQDFINIIQRSLVNKKGNSS